jgi:2-C-methyl-D-erythritol 4-phosphate cytidylyltransferase
MNATALIPAAGLGKRFGAKKQFLELAGRPVLVHTLRAFEESPSVAEICVAVPETEIDAAREMISRHGLKKPVQVVAGGKERQDSVRLAFESARPRDIVLVHDGVRPLVTPELIEETIAGAAAFGGCIAALPVKETVKKTDAEGQIVQTVDRASLWSVQTPQAFRHEIFRRAVERAGRDGFLGTDEAMLVEHLGEKVKVVTGSPYNIKITSPEDLRIAEAFLRMR